MAKLKKRKEKDEEDKKEINIFESNLVPKHELLTSEEKHAFLEKMNVSVKQLPRIRSSDSVIKVIGGKRGDIVKITRKTPISSEAYYYRVVV